MVTTEQVVVWRVSESCSLGCQFCGYSRLLFRPRRAIDVRQALTFGRVLADYQQQTGRSLLVIWLGGEPLEWPELCDLARTFCQQHRLRLGVTTSGLALSSPGVRAELLAHYEQVTISVDGLAGFHDRVRGMSGLFQRVRRGVHQLREEDNRNRLRLRVNTILMRGNIATFSDFCDALADWGIHELTFNQLGGNERPEFYTDNRLLPEQVWCFAAELPEIRRRMRLRGLHIHGSNRYLHRIACTTKAVRIPIEDCAPAQHFLFIDERGRVSPCSFTCDGYGISLDDITSAESLRELPDRFARLRRQYRLSPCADCHATHVFDKFDLSCQTDDFSAITSLPT